jgi:hypothetical protein
VNRRGTAVLAAAACLALAAGSAAGPAAGATASTVGPAASAASSGHWTAPAPVPGLAALNVGQNADLNDIACASAGNCAAGGAYTDKAGATQAWIASEVGGHWRAAREVPGTAALNAGGNAAVNLIACPGSGPCLAVGETANAAHTQSAFVATEAGNGTWATATPIAVGMSPAEISCPRAGHCLLGGAVATGQAAVSHAAVSVEDGAAWSAPQTLPGMAALAPDGSAVTILTCSSPGNCLAGGGYSPNHPHLPLDQLVFVAAEVNGVWHRAEPVLGVARMNTGHDADIPAVSCASAGNCSVGGSYATSNGSSDGFVANEVHGDWDAARTIPGSSWVTALRCTAPATCLAVGDAGGYGLIATEKNGTWGKNRLTTDSWDGTTLTAISCRSAGNCLVTGNFALPMEDDYSPGNESLGIAEINGTWGPVKFLTVPDNGATDSSIQSCARNGDCAIGGTIQYSSPVVEESTGSSSYVASFTP